MPMVKSRAEIHQTLQTDPAVVAEWAKATSNSIRGTPKVPGLDPAWGCMMEKILTKKDFF